MIDAMPAPEAGFRPHRPWLAAVLSFLFPGLGQAYAGRRRTALLMALPAVAIVLVVIGVYSGAIGGMRNRLFSSEFLIGVLVANAFILALRGISIVHAGLTPWDRIHGHDRRTALMVVAGLLVITVAMHAWFGGLVLQLNDTLGQIFAPVAAAERGPGGPPPGEGNQQPVNEPTFRWDGTDRINVLLVGTDAAPGRTGALTDVILVVSVDPVARTAVMISVPRDTGFVPLPDQTIYPDGLYPQKVNGLASAASRDPETWCPDIADNPAACGVRTLQRSVGLYLGLEIHHYAQIDMAGFAAMIDAVGGLDLCLDGRLVDPFFDGSLGGRTSDEPLILPEGCRLYNGIDALAYARSRQGWIETADGQRIPQTDFDRSERQQLVLLALRRELSEADTLLELPNLLRAIGQTITTDFPRDQAGDLASLLPLITGPDIDRVVLGYPEFVDLPVNPTVNYLLLPKRDAIRDEMARLFGEDNLVGWYIATDDPAPAEETGGESDTQ